MERKPFFGTGFKVLFYYYYYYYYYYFVFPLLCFLADRVQPRSFEILNASNVSFTFFYSTQLGTCVGTWQVGFLLGVFHLHCLACSFCILQSLELIRLSTLEPLTG